MEILKDRVILDRIGCGRGEYVVVDDGADDTSVDECIVGMESTVDDIDDGIDNSECDADFEKVEEGYHGQDGFMKGVLTRMRKSAKGFSEPVATYSSDGMYMMESKRGVSAYHGRDGRAQCLAIPQCKMMNSTVLDGDWVRHPVYAGEYKAPSGFSKNGDQFGSGVIVKDRTDTIHNLVDTCGFKTTGTHVPFDLWCVVGAVFGKALRVWRGVAKLDMSKMPCWMYIGIDEVFESLNPGCIWSDLSPQSKYEWSGNIVEAFGRLRDTSLAWDLPLKTDDGMTRNTYCTASILESTWVMKRVDSKDEARCMKEWNGFYEPCGFKVRVRGNMLFDFCWRRGNNSPAVVQVRRYEHDVRKVLGTKGWTRCFHMIWASWLVQYRNYWKRRNRGYDSCELVWSQREMLRAFDGGVFEIRHLSTEEMVQILEYHTQKYVFDHGEKRPAHIADVNVDRRCVVSWTLPRTLAGESVIVKNEAGVNMSLDEAGIASVPAEVVLARSRMKEINEENARHVVTVNGRRVDSSESVIYGCATDASGVMQGIWDRNGRCYSMKNGIQALKRDERMDVLIDGHRTVEVDYSSLHPHILYALNGITFHGDVYNVGKWYMKYGLSKDEARRACKKMMLITVNASNFVVAMYSFKKEWNLDHGLPVGTFIPWLYDLFDAISKRHSRIAHEFCTGKGVFLMNMDGRLLREVMHRLTRERICALGIHDSVLVETRYARKVAAVMREEYAKMFNGSMITVKY